MIRLPADDPDEDELDSDECEVDGAMLPVGDIMSNLSERLPPVSNRYLTLS